jgi:hypothetical protein
MGETNIVRLARAPPVMKFSQIPLLPVAVISVSIAPLVPVDACMVCAASG